MAGKSIFVLGGARSGKSAYAESLADGWQGKKIYLATAGIFDTEMDERVKLHRQRRGDDWLTIEEPLELVAALEKTMNENSLVLVDCLTLWLSNMMEKSADISSKAEKLGQLLDNPKGRVIVVSNEVGQGIVPDNALARRFRDESGMMNQIIASHCDRVVFVTAGLPLVLKGH